MANWDKLKEDILALIKEEVKDLWETEDEEFLEQLASNTAREKFLAVSSDNPTEHEQNLRHLAATLQGEVTRKQLRLNKEGQDLFVRALVLVIKTIALPALAAAI